MTKALPNMKARCSYCRQHTDVLIGETIVKDINGLLIVVCPECRQFDYVIDLMKGRGVKV